jgi:hypothetical protein
MSSLTVENDLVPGILATAAWLQQFSFVPQHPHPQPGPNRRQGRANGGDRNIRGNV